MTMLHPRAKLGIEPAVADALHTQELTKLYGGTPAVDRASLTFAAGAFTAILGPSGCGKSTLLGMIGGFIPPDAGDIAIGGRSILAMPPERRPTAMVFQTLALFPHLSVAGNIAFGMKTRKSSRGSIRGRVNDLLDLVRLPQMGDRRISELSGGQRQRVAIARALAVEPSILLLDEPLSALDAQMRAAMQLELRGIQERTGTTFIYVTHDQTEAMSMADQVVVMNAGQVEQHGPPQDVYARPQTEFVARFLGNANVVSAEPGNSASTLVALLRRRVPSESGPWAIRSESICLSAPASGQIPGVIRRSTFYGQALRYEVQAGLADPLIVSRPVGEPAFAVNDPVGLQIDFDRVVAVRRSAP